MAANKDHLLIQPIIRHLMQLVEQADGSPSLLPSEMSLCARFGVSRGTVRRAIGNLLDRGCVVHLPGRRGYFSNPRFSLGSCQQSLGILVGNGSTASMSGHSASMFSGFSETLRSISCSYHFLTLSSLESDVLETMVADLGLAGLLWLAPGNENMGAIRELQGGGFPVVGIESPYEQNSTVPVSNFLRYDVDCAGALRAANFLSSGCQFPLYCTELGIDSRPPRGVELFFQLMSEHGLPADHSRILGGMERLEARLSAWLDDGQADGVICEGDIRRYHQVFQVLCQHPRGGEVLLFLERSPVTCRLVSEYPQVQVRFFTPLDMHDIVFQAGRRAGQLMTALLQDKHVVFPIEYYR